MKELLEQKVAEACKELFEVEVVVDLTRPEEQFGDYSTNVALQLAKQVGKNPREIAETLAVKLRDNLSEQISEISVAGPGFLNLRLNDSSLVKQLVQAPAKSLEGQNIVAEYSDPNPFKVLHAGHLYTTIVGDAISNLLETAGATVHRVNFGGDVGMHVAKAMWGIVRHAGGPEMDENEALRFVMDSIANKTLSERAEFMSQRYVEGNNAYEDEEEAKSQITDFNQRVYQVHEAGDHDSAFAQIYRTCRGWSYEYFDQFYEQIGVAPFEKYYPESETAPIGITTVKEQLQKGVYEISDGAVIFRGEPYGLHTRVFLNSRGLPTYEGKEVGLIMKKWADYHFDKSFIITGNDIIGYMQVVQKSIEQFNPELTARSEHRTHGQVKLEGGVKMSSRKGNVLYANDILEAAVKAAKEANSQATSETAYSAVKYAFLKQRLGGDISYSPTESVALEGNSGPYVQYAHARAKSILGKAEPVGSLPKDVAFEPGERTLARKISEYPEVVDGAVAELMPHIIATYLYELTQTFNRFYEGNRVIGDDRQAIRVALVDRYAQILKEGLGLLGISAPDKM